MYVDKCFCFFVFFFFKQKTAYEISVRDWSSDVCSSDLRAEQVAVERAQRLHAPLRELLEPIRHRARRREAAQPTEPSDQRVPPDVLQVFESAGADHQQRENEQ